MTFEEAWKKENEGCEETCMAIILYEKGLFRRGYEAGYEAAKKEAHRVVSFFED
jgi:predicted metal-dependent hydrolase